MSESYETVWTGAAWREARPVPPPEPPKRKTRMRKRPQTRVRDAVGRVSLALQSGPHTPLELGLMTGLCASAIITALRTLRIEQKVSRSPEPPAFGRPRVRYTWIDR